MPSSTDPFKRTELHYAAMEGSPADVRRLIDEGLTVAARDREAFTPLHFAAMHGRPDNARVLLDAGADVDAQDGWGNTPLAGALFEGKNREEMVALLRERGADPYRENNYGASPISTAYLVADDALHRLFSDLPAPASRD
jgi:ankyrin repeat protein